MLATSVMQGICGANLSDVLVMNSKGDDANISKQTKVQANPELKAMNKALSALACHFPLA